VVRGPNFTKLGEDIRPSSLLTGFVSELRYLPSFLNAASSSLSDVLATLRMRPKFALLTPVKIRGGVGEISGLQFKALPRPNLAYRFDGRRLCHC